MGYSATESAVAYGQLTGMAINVLFIPAVLTFPFASNLLPMMAESLHTAQTTLKKRNFHRALSFSLVLGIPCSIIFVAAGPQICELLFGVPEAGRLLAAMGWLSWMIYLQHITTATLQGLGKPAIPARNAALCTLMSSASVITLSRAWPSLGIDAAVYSVMVGIITGALLGLTAVIKEIGGLRAATSTITKGALAGAFSLFLCENILSSMTSPSPLYHLVACGAVVVLSFFPAAWILRIQPGSKTTI